MSQTRTAPSEKKSHHRLWKGLNGQKENRINSSSPQNTRLSEKSNSSVIHPIME